MGQMLVTLESFDRADDTKILIFGVEAMDGVGGIDRILNSVFLMCTRPFCKYPR